MEVKGWGRRAAFGWCASLLLTVLVSACASRQPPPPLLLKPPKGPFPRALYGTASWYGPGFNGHRTSSGEIYNQNDLTAASKIFPLGTRLMVTNLANGNSVEVRINDHGPYSKGRALDLSHKAARMLGMLGPGTARVRMDVLDAPAGSERLIGHEYYFVQVGSFASASNARRLRKRLSTRYENVRVDTIKVGGSRFYQVRMGAFATYRAAKERARSAARFGLPVVIVQE